MPLDPTTAVDPPPAAPSAGPTARPLLKDRAYSELKELIQTGVFPPQTFLSERQLVDRLGMSKTPIRSALEHLEAQGLVLVSPQQGIVVKDLSAHEVADLFDMRAAIEPFLTARLADRGGEPGRLFRLDENLASQRAAAEAGDPLAATRLDIAFHMILAELVENHEATAWLARCFDKLHRAILRVNRLAMGRLSRSYEDHAAITEAVRAARGADAADRMTRHLAYGRDFLLRG